MRLTVRICLPLISPEFLAQTNANISRNLQTGIGSALLSIASRVVVIRDQRRILQLDEQTELVCHYLLRRGSYIGGSVFPDRAPISLIGYILDIVMILLGVVLVRRKRLIGYGKRWSWEVGCEIFSNTPKGCCWWGRREIIHVVGDDRPGNLLDIDVTSRSAEYVRQILGKE